MQVLYLSFVTGSVAETGPRPPDKGIQIKFKYCNTRHENLEKSNVIRNLKFDKQRSKYIMISEAYISLRATPAPTHSINIYINMI